MYELGVVYRNITRADADVATKLGPLGSATVHEAMGRVGLMKPFMRPIYAGAQVSGTAVTVLLHPGDNWMMHVAAEQIDPLVEAQVPPAILDNGVEGIPAERPPRSEPPMRQGWQPDTALHIPRTTTITRA